LRCALYGLKQAGLSWWKELTTSMTELGFMWCKSNASVYYFRDLKTCKLVIAVVYVDDISFLGQKNSQLLKQLKLKFSQWWQCHDQGTMNEFLGMQILRDQSCWKIFLHQQKYLQKVLDWFRIKSRPEDTPLPKGFAFNPATKIPKAKFRAKYQQLVGSLMYLMIGSHPDIAFVVVKMSQHTQQRALFHWNASFVVFEWHKGYGSWV
jgi:hypothetical protein